jgi:hypothetical protein
MPIARPKKISRLRLQARVDTAQILGSSGSLFADAKRREHFQRIDSG